MVFVDDYIVEKECVYKDEHYLVRDNGAVLRFPLEGKKVRPLDNKWTFGIKNQKTGYMSIGGHRVHIIVATAFHGANDSKKLVVDHIDTNRCNNRPENLRWVTRLENILLNEATRTKIEYLCGSVENFLKNPKLLKGHEQQDPNFGWMRTVTKEEAENTLKNLDKLLAEPHKSQSKGQLGEWLISGTYQTNSSPLQPTQTIASALLPVKSREQLQQDMAKRRRLIEKKRQEKEEAKKEAARLRREQAKERRKEARKKKSIANAVVSSMLNNEKYINIKTVKVRFIPTECYCCGQEHYMYYVIGLINESMPALSTYEGIYNARIEVDIFDPVLVSSVKQYLANHPELHYSMGEIKERFSKTMSQSYMSFGCPECDALVGDHYLQEAFWNMEYEPDDEFVHIIELPKPGLKVKIEQYNHF